MGLGKEQSLIVMNEFLKTNSEKLSAQERMVFQWCKILLTESGSSYWQGVTDGMVLAEGIVELGKSLKEISMQRASNPSMMGDYTGSFD